MTKKAKRDFFKDATKDGIMTSKKFWSTAKPFLTNNGCIFNDAMSIENEGNLICNEVFNEHYINIAEKSSDKKPLSLGNSSDASQDEMTFKEIISVYSNHPSFRKIKNYVSLKINLICHTQAQATSINKGPDGISAKFVKMSAVIDCHLANLINNDISLNKYSKHAKTATVRPIFKKDDRTKIKNYRPVSLLNIFSKL